MAFNKPTIIPGYGAPVCYFRIDKVEVDQLVQEATFLIRAYKDAATAADPAGQGYHHSGLVKVQSGATFTTYFSRAALAAAGKSVHAQAYQLIKDYNAGVTAAQQNVRIANDFGGAAFFKDATDV